jgi:hypothetical protein
LLASRKENRESSDEPIEDNSHSIVQDAFSKNVRVKIAVDFEGGKDG